jgi:single-stranded-DNA-specific exonuclease
MEKSNSIARHQRTFVQFLSRHELGKDFACVCHNDADGVSSAVLLHHCLADRNPLHIIPTQKAETPWSARVQQEISVVAPDAVIVCDFSPRGTSVMSGLANLIIDHHKPDGVADGTTLITGYGEPPVPTSGLLAYWCGSAVADLSPYGWIAALSVLADLSNIRTFPELQGTFIHYPVKLLQRCVSLLNAPRRTGTGNAEPALRLLLRASTPHELLDANDPDVQLLITARTEVNRELARAKRSPPRFSGPVALICVNSPCQVHPLIAQIGRTRLPEYIVIAANFGYRAGYVHFSVRSTTTRNLIKFLKKHTPVGAGENFARGHDKATGGSIPVDSWDEFARSLGFSPEEARWQGAI